MEPLGPRVEIARWPTEADRIERLRADGVPRLLLVSNRAAPPLFDDLLEDWVRIPADPEEVSLRLERLARIATGRRDTRRRPVAPTPQLQRDGDRR